MSTTKNELILSDKLDSIYYADLFKIKNKVWMITGAGKSKAARMAVDNNKEADLARDAVAIFRDNDILYGRYDPGAFNPTLGIEPWSKLDFIAHCLTEEETQRFYPKASKNIEVINNKLLAAFLGEYIHIYPIFMVNKTETFSVEQYLWLQDPQRRINHF